MYIKCDKGHTFNPDETKMCPVCKYGKPHGEIRPENDFNLNVSPDKPNKQGEGGGPKPKERKCLRCGFMGIVKRNPKGNSANCASCGKRIY